MHQRSFASGSRQAPDPYDQFLEQHGFYRKHTARDSSSLFRIISEQMFDTQLYHMTIRQSCVRFMRKNSSMFKPLIDRDFDGYLEDLSKIKTFGTLIELQALAQLYRRNIVLFKPFNLGNNFGEHNDNYEDVFRVFCSPDQHFDSVFTSDYIADAAMCQSICYEILYKDFFKLPDVSFAVDQMLYDPSRFDHSESGTCFLENEDGYCTRINISKDCSFELNLPCETNCILENSEQCRFHAESKNSDKKDADDKQLIKKSETEVLLPKKYISCVRQLLQEGITPFPYKVAKALDPTMYRNIEFDSWNEQRKEQRLQNWYYGGSDFKVGAKCYVKLRNSSDHHDLYTCHIQEISVDKTQCVVFIEKLGERHLVSYNALSPLPADQFQPWSLPYRLQKSVCKGNSRRNTGVFRHYNSTAFRHKCRGHHYDASKDVCYIEKSVNCSQKPYVGTNLNGYYDNYMSDPIDAKYTFGHYTQPIPAASYYSKLTDLTHFIPPPFEYCTMPLTTEHATIFKSSEVAQSNVETTVQPVQVEDTAATNEDVAPSSNETNIDEVNKSDDTCMTNTAANNEEPCQFVPSETPVDANYAVLDPNNYVMCPAMGNSFEYPANMYAIHPQVVAISEDSYQYNYEHINVGYQQPPSAPIYYMCNNGTISAYNTTAAVQVPNNVFVQTPLPAVGAPIAVPQTVLTPAASIPAMPALQPAPQPNGYYMNSYFPSGPPSLCSNYNGRCFSNPQQSTAPNTDMLPNSNEPGFNRPPTPSSGRVNFEARKSSNTSGSDLPDLFTLRYFYNLGIEHYQNMKNKPKAEDDAGHLGLQLLEIKEAVHDSETQTHDSDQRNESESNNNNISGNKNHKQDCSRSDSTASNQAENKMSYNRRNSYRGNYSNRSERNQQNYHQRNYGGGGNNNTNNNNPDFLNNWNNKHPGMGPNARQHNFNDWHNQRNMPKYEKQRRHNLNTDAPMNRRKTNSMSSSSAMPLPLTAKDVDEIVPRNSPTATMSSGEVANSDVKMPFPSPALQNCTPGLTVQNSYNPVHCPPPSAMPAPLVQPAPAPMGGMPPFFSIPPPNIMQKDIGSGNPNISPVILNTMNAGQTETYNRSNISSISSDNGENTITGHCNVHNASMGGFIPQAGPRMPVYYMPPPPNAAGCVIPNNSAGNMVLQPTTVQQAFWNLPPPPPPINQPTGPLPLQPPSSWHTPQKFNVIDQNVTGSNRAGNYTFDNNSINQKKNNNNNNNNEVTEKNRNIYPHENRQQQQH